MFAANSVPPITPPIGGSGNNCSTAASGVKEDPGTYLLTKATPSQNVTINLINRLVARGVLPKEDAEALIQQAEADAIEARALAAATQAAVADAQAVVSQHRSSPSRRSTRRRRTSRHTRARTARCG